MTSGQSLNVAIPSDTDVSQQQNTNILTSPTHQQSNIIIDPTTGEELDIYDMSLNQVPEEKITLLKNHIVLQYTNLNLALEKNYPILATLANILPIKPISITLIACAIISLVILFAVPGGPALWFKTVGFVIPFFLSWNSLYTVQPFHNAPIATQNATSPRNTTTTTTSASTTTTQQQNDDDDEDEQTTLQNTAEVQVAQTNDPAYLFWAKYWLIYVIFILVDNMTMTLFQSNLGTWCFSNGYQESALYKHYIFWLNLHFLLLITPPYFYSQVLYNFILEPLLIVHFDKIFETYRQAKDSLGMVMKDGVANATTALKTLGTRAVLGGLQTFNQ